MYSYCVHWLPRIVWLLEHWRYGACDVHFLPTACIIVPFVLHVYITCCMFVYDEFSSIVLRCKLEC